MAERTLGSRILDAAHEYGVAIRPGSPVASTEWGALKALAARADAAEGLAKAAFELSECNTEDGDLLRQVREEYNEALAAWRAIDKEVTG